MATHSSIFAGKPHGQRNLEAHSPGGCKESDTTDNIHTQGKSKFFFFFLFSTCVLFWLQCIYAYQCLSTWSNKSGARSLTLCDTGSPPEKRMPIYAE